MIRNTVYLRAAAAAAVLPFCLSACGHAADDPFAGNPTASSVYRSAERADAGFSRQDDANGHAEETVKHTDYGAVKSTDPETVSSAAAASAASARRAEGKLSPEEADSASEQETYQCVTADFGGRTWYIPVENGLSAGDSTAGSGGESITPLYADGEDGVSCRFILAAEDGSAWTDSTLSSYFSAEFGSLSGDTDTEGLRLSDPAETELYGWKCVSQTLSYSTVKNGTDVFTGKGIVWMKLGNMYAVIQTSSSDENTDLIGFWTETFMPDFLAANGLSS